MWNLEKLLSVLVASEKSLGECQNYATTLWEAGSKGKLCYQHPAAWQKTKTGQKLHQNLIPMKSEWGWFGKNTLRWNIYFGKMDRYIWPGAQLWWRLPFAFTSASPPKKLPPKIFLDNIFEILSCDCEEGAWGSKWPAAFRSLHLMTHFQTTGLFVYFDCKGFAWQIHR